MLSDLTKSYLAELDARAAQGDTLARDYGDVCRLEFEARLEGCVLALAKRDRDEVRAEFVFDDGAAYREIAKMILPASAMGATGNLQHKQAIDEARRESRQGRLF